MIGPENTRLYLQFTKIDLEEQNDCLYDYISIEDDETYERAGNSGNGASSGKSTAMLTPDNDRNYLSEDYASDGSDEIDRDRNKRNPFVVQSQKSATAFKRISIEPSFLSYVRWCGTHESNMTRFDFISASNTALIYFHSDYSVSGSGFSLTWKAVSMGGCPTQTYTAHDDFNTIESPNYPNVLLNNLNCKYVIYAASSRHIWLEFQSFNLIRDASVEIDLGNGAFVPFQLANQLNDGAFVSYQNRITIHLRTGDKPNGFGFKLAYKTCKRHALQLMQMFSLVLLYFCKFYCCNFMSEILWLLDCCLCFVRFYFPFDSVSAREQRNILLSNKTNGILNHLNYPQPQPTNIDFTQHIVAPLGEVILLELHNVGISESGCHSADRIEVCFAYASSSIGNEKLFKMWCLSFRFTIIMLTLMDPFGICANYPHWTIIIKTMRC